MVRNPAIDPSIYHGDAPEELPPYSDYKRGSATPDEPEGSTHASKAAPKAKPKTDD